MTTPNPDPVLAAVEAEHGFTFGGTPTAGPGRPVAAVVCSTPGCTHRAHHIQLHDDTPWPVHCGGCGAVLYCQHSPATRVEKAGTLGNPVQHQITACTICGTELDRTTTALPPVDLATLPVGVLEQPHR